MNEGELIGKAIIPYNPTMLNASARTIGNINYTIKIYVKDGRYKYEITDFTHEPTGKSKNGGLSFGIITNDDTSPIRHKGQFKKWNNKVWIDIKNQINDSTKPLIEDLKTKMVQKSEIQNDDW